MAKIRPIISPVDIEARRATDVRAGDTVRVHQKIKEADGKTRIQVFEGIVLARKHGAEAGGTITVRRVADGFAVEKIFPVYSPVIEKFELIKRAKVRRAKLYYIRDKAAREIKRHMRSILFTDETADKEPVSKENPVEPTKPQEL